MRTLIFIGDIHGEFKELNYLIHKRYKLQDCDFVQVGDFGIGFYKPNYYKNELSRINETLKQNNNNLYVVRGNHDDPSYFNGKMKDFLHFSNLKLMEDYSIINHENNKILCIGGGVSIDRAFRTENKSWWKDEIIKIDNTKLEELKNINIVASHTCPSFAPPFSKEFSDEFFNKDKNLKQDLKNERIAMTEIFHKIQKHNDLKFWFYGHFHGNSEMTNKFVELYSVKFRFCDINEFVLFN